MHPFRQLKAERCYGLKVPVIESGLAEYVGTRPAWPFDPPRLLYMDYMQFPREGGYTGRIVALITHTNREMKLN